MSARAHLNNDDFRDELAVYALGALDAGETVKLERHLDGCAQCREYLIWLDPAVNLLPMSVEQHQPPRQLRRSLMSDVRGDIKAARRSERDRERTSRGLWGTIWRPATAVAATAVLVAGVVGGYALRGDDPGQVSTFVTAKTTEPGVGALLVATLERQGDRGTLHVEKLPALPQDRVYQAWIERDGKMEPSTEFVVGRDGTTEVAIKGTLDNATAVLITREPEGGSKRPTLPVIMKAPLT